jgi:ferredoxin
MIQFILNNNKVSVPEGTTILKASRELDINIPTMCYKEGLPHNTSCMICVVEDMNSSKLIPSCSAPVAEGMQIETDNDRVRDFRKDTLDLLLSEHVGDCMAPCHRTCPAYMDIPLMIRQIQQKDWKAAIKTVKADIPLPAVLGRICSAPCEKGCNRNQYDTPVSICLLKRIVADIDLESVSPYLPEKNAETGKKVAIVGAGPAGLSAAYYLRQMGHACVIYDKNDEPGGNLLYAVPDDILQKDVLLNEINQIEKLDVKFQFGQSLGIDFSLDELTKKNDAVILATGKIDPELFQTTNLIASPRGLKVDRKTLETNIKGVFAGGSLVSASQMAVKSVGHGKAMALSVDQYLVEKNIVGRPKRFNSLMGRLQEGESAEYLKEAKDIVRIEPKGGLKNGFSEDESVEEAYRCFHCDCRKQENCKLRNYTDEYGADQSKFKIGKRNPFEKQVQHDLIVFEPGKCVKCGLCVQITENASEKFGLTFINRGFDVKISIPFGEALEKGLEKVAKQCAEACPTAAIAMKK